MPNFEATSHQGKIIIQRAKTERRIEMSPSEAERASKIVGIALSMIEVDNKPPSISNTPFVIRFFSEGVCALERSDVEGSIPFRVHEGDELIKFIRMGLGKCLNEQTQGRVVPHTPAEQMTLVSDESV